MNVWTYWKCTACDSIIRGDSRDCPCCGQPIPDGVKYMMPDDPIVVNAIANNNILIGNPKTPESKTHIDEKGIISDIVPEELESDKPNWICDYCGYQNYFANTTCEGCGAGKEDATHDYFGNRPEMDQKNRKDYKNRTGLDYKDPQEQYETSTINTPVSESDNHASDYKNHVKNILNDSYDFIKENWAKIAITIGSVLLVIFLIWLFTPITRTATIQGFSWERSIDVEKYTLCHENGWSVPSGAHVTSQKEEIHHYDSVFDHYETKTKQVSERVLDGYDTEYVDKGNGQAEVVKTPKYKTVYHTETYKEPVYKQVPVYKTKYYYDIGRWKHYDSLDTEGYDKNPYWKETDIPEDINHPSYDDKRLGSRHETYIAIIYDDGAKSVQYNYSTWMDLQEGDMISYKTFRFSHTPLYGE